MLLLSVLSGIFVLTFPFAQKHTPAGLSTQSQIVMAEVQKE